MGRIPPFAVEQWMDEYETKAKFNIAETCCASISIDELANLSENKATKASDIIDLSAAQTYGEIRGNAELRNNLSRLYSSKTASPLSPDNILITPGAIAANHLVLYTMTGPETLGAKVDLWKSNPDSGWLPDFDALKSMVRENTKLIILNNPQNPTGAIIPRPLLHQVVDFAEAKNITILADEVYRPLFHGISPISNDFPPSLLSTGYQNTIVTGSMSKAYSLAGIRVGWIASRNRQIIEECAKTRDYTTISVSKLDQAVAAFALSSEVVHGLLGRNIQLAKENMQLLERFVIKHDEYCSWTKPVGGTTAFIKFERDGKPIDAAAFCKTLQEKTGVMLLPGDVGFGPEFKGYVRFGYVNQTAILKEALEETRKFMRKEYDDIPLCE